MSLVAEEGLLFMRNIRFFCADVGCFFFSSMYKNDGLVLDEKKKKN